MSNSKILFWFLVLSAGVFITFQSWTWTRKIDLIESQP